MTVFKKWKGMKKKEERKNRRKRDDGIIEQNRQKGGKTMNDHSGGKTDVSRAASTFWKFWICWRRQHENSSIYIMHAAYSARIHLHHQTINFHLSARTRTS